MNWFEDNDIDWFFCLNMILFDVVFVMLVIYYVVKKYWVKKNYGGVIFWDYDFFGSYVIYENVERLYLKIFNILILIL